MDISLERKFISSFKTIGSAKKICDISSDIVVPDTKEDILRVIMTNAQYKIRSKDVESGRVVVRGELRVSVAYVPESGDGISTLDTDIPFETEFEVESADNGCSAIVELDLISVDTRILNPRKVMVNAQLCVSQKCYCITDFTWYTAPTDEIDNAFFKKNTAEIRLINLVSEKTFSLEDDFTVQNLGENAQLFAPSVSFRTDSAEAVGSKLIVKGHADIKAVILNNGGIESAESTVSFSQIFELPERDIVPDYRACVLSTGDYFELSDGRISYEIHAVMQIACREEKSIEYIEDAYVCAAELSPNLDSKQVCASERTLSQKEDLQLSYTADSDIDKVIYITAAAGNPKSTNDEVTVSLCAEGVYITADKQLKAFKVYGNANFNYDTEQFESIEKINIELESVKATVNGKDITVSLSVVTQMQIQKYCTLEMLASAVISEPEERRAAPSVYMCRAQGNDLWSIAKRYDSSVDMISSLNSLDQNEDITGRMLIIPRIK